MTQSGFTWTTSPDVFNEGMVDYELKTFAVLFDLCVQHAQRIQDWMRQTAPWEDTCMPGKEYLRAEAFYPDQWSVGIRVWYDLDLYRSQCGEPAYDWGSRHEQATFAHAGVISIILPRGIQGGVLDLKANELMDAVRALYA